MQIFSLVRMSRRVKMVPLPYPVGPYEASLAEIGSTEAASRVWFRQPLFKDALPLYKYLFYKNCGKMPPTQKAAPWGDGGVYGCNVDKKSSKRQGGADAVNRPRNHFGLNHFCRRSPVMQRTLLIFLSLVLVLVGWSTVGAEDGFYVIPIMKQKYAPVPKTGQTTSYATGDDGDLEKGVAWPTPRFTDNGNGTVKDNLTGLIWMQNANAFGQRTWLQALSDAKGLKDGIGSLNDGSKEGDWRLPNARELQSLSAIGKTPAVGPPFNNVQVQNYWSSSSFAESVGYVVILSSGAISGNNKDYFNYVLCVRGGP
jgi:hypothetical protein